MEFTETLWDDIGHIYEEILDLPFNKELMNGTLSEDVFAFYMKQDALYLEDFSRALAIAGAKSDSAAELKDFLDFATGAVIVERALHDSFLKRFNTHINIDKSPACFSYTNFLLSAAYNEDYFVAIGALLPCFWIYREVGHYIFKKAVKENPYQDWIDTYAGDDFSNSVNRMIEITEYTAERSSDYQRDKMKRAFVYSAKLEWMFWDSAYRKEKWPV